MRVGVGVERDTGRVVTEGHLNLLYRAARGDQHRGEEVPEVVKRDRVVQAGALACPTEVVAPPSGVERLAIGSDDDAVLAGCRRLDPTGGSPTARLR